MGAHSAPKGPRCGKLAVSLRAQTVMKAAPDVAPRKSSGNCSRGFTRSAPVAHTGAEPCNPFLSRRAPVTRLMRLAGGTLLTLAAVLADAHAHLQSSVPANGSHIASLPANLVLTFSEPARLTVLWIQKDGADKQKVSTSTLPTATARELSVPLPRLAPGAYDITFRTLSADGHVALGELRFTLGPSQQ